MVVVAQLVRALGCGPRGRGFESPHPPHSFPRYSNANQDSTALLFFSIGNKKYRTTILIR